MTATAATADRRFFVGLARAFGGAVFFSLPLLMTMEMWQLGHYLPRGRVALFILLILPILIVLDRFSGFMRTDSWAEDAVDGLIAFGVGAVAATAVLLVFDVINFGMPLREIVGKVALQAVPGGFGAVLANSQFSAERGSNGSGRDDSGGDGDSSQPESYPAEVFFMLVGAVFLAFNVAPTEEIVLLAVRMSAVHLVVMLLATLAMMHAFVFAAGFRGSPQHGRDEKWWGLFLRFTLVGYAVALLVSAWVLWTFGRFTSLPPADVVAHAVVLALPAGLGAAAARLIL
jgi:putative integral membrane protein (TIGR02587 family)